METQSSSNNIDVLRSVINRNLKLRNYESALYWADKVMTLSADNVEDVLVCANCLYHTGQYHRAVAVVKNRIDLKTNAEGVLLIANCYYACADYEKTALVLTEFLTPAARTFHHKSSTQQLNPKTPTDSHILSAMHLLLGKSYEGTGSYDLSTEQFRQALVYDVYCHEAFDKIIGHHLLTASQEQELLDQLPFEEQCAGEDNCKTVSTLYRMQIKKYAGHEVLSIPSEMCALEENLDVIVSLAERFYCNCYFRDAYKITSKVLNKEPFHLKCLPLHIVLLVELRKPRDLFYLAHRLVDTYPTNAISWFAVACYYHLIHNNELARQYFSKATSLDGLFGPAWLVFGHSFAAESEHDQAMAAYFRASQLMKGCHLPFLYIGLEYGLTSTTKLAEKFFMQAQAIAPDDPFVIHEIGVIDYQNGRYRDCEVKMKQALSIIDSLDLKKLSHLWEPLLNNMAHTCRKLRKYEEAISYHRKALILKSKNASTLSGIGYNYMLMYDFEKAVEYFHKSLSIRKNDSFAMDMIKIAMDELVNDLNFNVKVIDSYEPLQIERKLNLTQLRQDTTARDESLPNTPQYAPREPTPQFGSGDQSGMSIEMEMSLDD
ncbi:CDC16 [Bugula neritina]|uniref:CDC16 n=1 Tax=Bugula neritina TaxID=10212 RepID=A0A7J7KQP2_BUGNE|nr:CDC16 [Bugula neritina]